MIPNPGSFEAANAAKQRILSMAGVNSIDVAMILGTGVGSFGSWLFPEPRKIIPYQDILSNLVNLKPSVNGHGLKLLIDTVGEKQGRIGTPFTIAIGDGRFHKYQGYEDHELMLLLRGLILASAQVVVLVSAVGSLNDKLWNPPQVAMVCDHINFSGVNPVVGIDDKRIGTLHPDMGEVYTLSLRQQFAQCITHENVSWSLEEAVAGMTVGPPFETPAESIALQRLGAGVATMSMPAEATAAHHMGAKVLGLAFITNLASCYPGQLTADEVAKATEAGMPDFQKVMQYFLQTLDFTPLK